MFSDAYRPYLDVSYILLRCDALRSELGQSIDIGRRHCSSRRLNFVEEVEAS